MVSIQIGKKALTANGANFSRIRARCFFICEHSRNSRFLFIAQLLRRQLPGADALDNALGPFQVGAHAANAALEGQEPEEMLAG
jgi:hypothetical protein